jgi:hypothetical protein
MLRVSKVAVCCFHGGFVMIVMEYKQLKEALIEWALVGPAFTRENILTY